MINNGSRNTLKIENQLLKRKLSDYQRLFDTSDVASLIIDTHGHPLDCNQAYFNLLGLSDLSQITPFDFSLISPEKQTDGSRSSEKAKELLCLAKKYGKHSFEWLYKSLSGREFQSSVTIHYVSFDEKPSYRISIHDISELKNSKDEVDSIFKNSLVGLFLVGKEREVVRCNQRAADILGYDSPEEMIGINTKDFHRTEQHFLDFFYPLR
ncbi:PAS domain-containing protein [Vibrio sp. JC009]|uniref:PAS domain-containing protein n=1 Tax=Vibrio sp. JC009 TaxID=2912314 RepID=UPI0023B0F988|nr:PAS domain-containing protein [Vibrio sp. JC009]WED24100.1 PAS domain-containing protein [Vibrio sp. JC009]